MLGGLPATGAIARTVAGIENGAKSPLTGVFHSVFVLVMYFALMSVLKFVPLAVFAAILISVAINMSRFPLFIKLCKFGKRDTAVLIVSCVLTVVFDLTYGVIGGVVLALLVNIQNMRTKLKLEKAEPETQENTDLEKQVSRGVTLVATGSLYFININKFADKISKELESAAIVTVDMAGVTRIDSTSLEKIAKLSRAAVAQGKTLEFINYGEKVQPKFEKFYKLF